MDLNVFALVPVQIYQSLETADFIEIYLTHYHMLLTQIIKCDCVAQDNGL